jgi:hypothetical protein
VGTTTIPIGEIGTRSEKLLNAKAKSVERDFPHIVETAVPKASLSVSLDTIYGFHRSHGIPPRIGQEWLDETGRHHIRWCFAVPTIAMLFQYELGVR